MAQCMNAFAMQAWTPEFERQNPRISLKARRNSTDICNPVHPLEMAETRDSPEPQRPAHRVYTDPREQDWHLETEADPTLGVILSQLSASALGCCSPRER